jgi:GTP-binding protein
MIVGENSRENDLDVNPTKAKAFSNMREANKDATVVLKAARRMSLEMALEYIASDEAVEITPTSIRMRKIILSEAERRRQSRNERARAAGAAT